VSKYIYLMCVLLIAQTTNTTSWTEYTLTMSSLLSIIIHLLIVFIIPILLIYGLFKGMLDVFKTRMLKLLPAFALVAQTQFVDEVTAILVSLFMIILPAFFTLLLWKAFIKLVKL